MVYRDLIIIEGAKALFSAFIVIGVITLLIFYLVSSLALMRIAEKTETEPVWLAWIPIANIFLMVFIARKEWWWTFIILLTNFIPVVGGFISIGTFIYIWWLITEKLEKPGALSLLLLVPVVNLGYLLYLAYCK